MKEEHNMTCEEHVHNVTVLTRRIFSAECEIKKLKDKIAEHKEDIKVWQRQLTALGIHGLDATIDLNKRKSTHE